MKPPPGTDWREWTAVCPKCHLGFGCPDGEQFDAIVASHRCEVAA